MDHLADAPIANILIIAGVIFLSVGLFGRVGGFIGSIFGNIEAGKGSRILGGLLGALLILGGRLRSSRTPPMLWLLLRQGRQQRPQRRRHPTLAERPYWLPVAKISPQRRLGPLRLLHPDLTAASSVAGQT